MPSLPGQALQSFHLTCASAALAMRQWARRRRPHPAVLSPSPPQFHPSNLFNKIVTLGAELAAALTTTALPPPSRSIPRLCLRLHPSKPLPRPPAAAGSRWWPAGRTCTCSRLTLHRATQVVPSATGDARVGRATLFRAVLFLSLLRVVYFIDFRWCARTGFELAASASTHTQRTPSAHTPRTLALTHITCTH
jgi:hypothetical protein